MTDEGMTLNLPAIQGIVLRGYRMPLGSNILLEFHDAQAAGAWVRDMTPEVTTESGRASQGAAVVTSGVMSRTHAPAACASWNSSRTLEPSGIR